MKKWLLLGIGFYAVMIPLAGLLWPRTLVQLVRGEEFDQDALDFWESIEPRPDLDEPTRRARFLKRVRSLRKEESA
jgi:hypothetical protein